MKDNFYDEEFYNLNDYMLDRVWKGNKVHAISNFTKVRMVYRKLQEIWFERNKYGIYKSYKGGWLTEYDRDKIRGW